MAKIRGPDENERFVVFGIEVTGLMTSLLKLLDDDEAVFQRPGSRRSSLAAETAYLRKRVRCVWPDDPQADRRLTHESFREFFLKNAGRYDRIFSLYLVGLRSKVRGETMTPEKVISYYMLFEEELLIYDQAKDLIMPIERKMSLMDQNKILAERMDEFERQMPEFEAAFGVHR